jgi:ribosomal protein S27E
MRYQGGEPGTAIPFAVPGNPARVRIPHIMTTAAPSFDSVFADVHTFEDADAAFKAAFRQYLPEYNFGSVGFSTLSDLQEAHRRCYKRLTKGQHDAEAAAIREAERAERAPRDRAPKPITENTLIRQWAQEEGIPVSDRGRIAAEVIAAYHGKKVKVVAPKPTKRAPRAPQAPRAPRAQSSGDVRKLNCPRCTSEIVTRSTTAVRCGGCRKVIHFNRGWVAHAA